MIGHTELDRRCRDGALLSRGSIAEGDRDGAGAGAGTGARAAGKSGAGAGGGGESSELPGATDCKQVAPQPIPAGMLVTVPVPEPPFATATVTGVPFVPDPLRARETVSPPAVKFTLPAKVPVAVGRNRTVTAWLAPAVSENERPDRML